MEEYHKEIEEIRNRYIIIHKDIELAKKGIEKNLYLIKEIREELELFKNE